VQLLHDVGRGRVPVPLLCPPWPFTFSTRDALRAMRRVTCVVHTHHY